MENKWEKFVNYLREKELNEIVTRLELIEMWEDENIDPFINQFSKSIDSYIYIAKRCGALKTVTNGKYEIKNRLAKGIKITTIRNYLKGDWKAWFCNDIFESE